MSNIIKLLPEAVANQIAAGEVIQRPASAIKELLENSVDSGAGEISLVLKDAGKTLIQVVDDGCGMNAMDARMSFERHATSKISKADDLFAIRTLGFRGEALASIAAIARVEMKTRPKQDELGTCLIIEGSKLVSSEPCACKAGTTISVKNLFFNVPARRNFLKSNTTETRHSVEEFIRVALVYPQVGFAMYHNNKLVYKLPKANFKQRIVDIFGKTYRERLLPVNQKTDIVSINGFIAKAEFAKKTRGEQYFFVNGRYVKHAYLNHAVTSAFNELLPADAYPSYFLNIVINPADIDINIHPTKTEVNFKDGRYIYSVVHASVREAIGKYNITPTLNFDEDRELNDAFHSRPSGKIKPPSITVNPDYNPFESTFKSNEQSRISSGFIKNRNSGDKNWENLFENFENKTSEQLQYSDSSLEESQNKETYKFFQIHKKFICCNVRSGLMIIDQQKAHERILYENYMNKFTEKNQASQQQLFPHEIHFSPSDIELIKSIGNELKTLGFTLSTGKKGVIVKGVPADLSDNDIAGTLEAIVEDAKKFLNKPGTDKKIRLARTLASRTSIKQGKVLTEEEMTDIFDKLFACSLPDIAPGGEKIVAIIPVSHLESFLK
jgi:DNA mismatch repair protein MutL